MNKFIITGRLTRNPELRYTNNNIAITELNLAINNKAGIEICLPLIMLNIILNNIC